MNSFFNGVYKHTRRIVITVVGISVLLIGGAMIFLPGPAIIVIPLGLGILATEFIWAKNLMEKVKEKAKNLKNGRLQK